MHDSVVRLIERPVEFDRAPGRRVRVDNYLISYTVNDDILVVAVIALGHRRDVNER